MSFELSELVLGCGFEKGARRALLEAIAHFADAETGLARVSLAALAQRAGMSERNAYRWLPKLVGDPETDGLVTCLRHGQGRGNTHVYRLHLARLEPVRAAINTARRRIYAGAAKALNDAGLSGAKASNTNIRRVFAVLVEALRAEQEFTTARTVEALAGEFELAAARHAEISVIGRPIEGVPAASEPVESCQKPCQTVRVSEGLNPDSLSRKPDSLTIGHNKDNSPSGITPSGASPLQGCGKILAGAATSWRDFIFDVEGVLAHAALCRADRLALMGALQGRLARVSPDGVLALRCTGPAEAEAMAARWLEPLLGWAADAGLSGVVFDAAVRAPP